MRTDSHSLAFGIMAPILLLIVSCKQKTGQTTTLADSSAQQTVTNDSQTQVLDDQNHHFIPAKNQNNRWGFVDSAGKVLIDYKYGWVDNFYNGKARITINKHFAYIDTLGRLIDEIKYNFIERYHNNRAWVRKDGLWAVIDQNGKEIVPPRFADKTDFYEGTAIVENLTEDQGVMDTTGKLILPLSYKDVHREPLGHFMAQDSNYSIITVDLQGKIKTYAQYNGMTTPVANRAAFRTKDGLYGYQDAKGKIVIPPEYSYATAFENDRAVVSLNDSTNLYAVIDTSDHILQRFTVGKTPILNGSFEKVAFTDELKGMIGFYDKNQKIAAFFISGAGEYEDGLLNVDIDGKSGFIDSTGKIIIPIKYDEVRPFWDGIALVKNNDLYGFIDKKGRPITDVKYEEADHFEEGIAGVSEDWKWGFIDSTGKEITPIAYDAVYFPQNGLAMVKKESGKYCYINLQGKEVTSPRKEKFIRILTYIDK